MEPRFIFHLLFVDLQNRYDEAFAKTVYGVPLLTLNQVLTGALPEQRAVRVQYSDKQSFKTQAKQLGIMEDLKVHLIVRIAGADIGNA